jgi:hypothetical protein
VPVLALSGEWRVHRAFPGPVRACFPAALAGCCTINTIHDMAPEMALIALGAALKTSADEDGCADD